MIVTIVVSLRLMTTIDWDNWKTSSETAKGEYINQLLYVLIQNRAKGGMSLF